jgi:type VI secretion system protein ImpE
MLVEQSLIKGSLADALTELQAKVRKEPANAKLRIFLFQLLAVLGQWERAMTQLNVLGDMDVSTLPMVQTYREAVLCEMLRARIFAGQRSPLVFGQPARWIALLLEALRLSGLGEYGQSQEVRAQAFELAPTTSGRVGGESGEPFEWIADADTRMGPMLEAIVNGKYYWIAFQRIRTIQIEEPADLRDLVWVPAYFTWANGGEAPGLIPTRYPGSEASEDDQIRMARRTEWQQRGEDVYVGLGQRMLATESSEYSLMDLRLVSLDSPEVEGKNAGADSDEASPAPHG